MTEHVLPERNPAGPSGRTLGRPVDVEASARILDSALQVYGQRGWHGYNLHQVSLHARVGRALMYSRWTDRESLLIHAFKALAYPAEIDLRSPLRALLIRECEVRLSGYTGRYGDAIMRLSGEARSIRDPTLISVHEAVYRDHSLRLVEELRRRRTNGEIPEDVSITLFLDAVEGALYMHVMLTPDDRLEDLWQRASPFAARLVDQQLRIIGLSGEATPGRSGYERGARSEGVADPSGHGKPGG